MTRTHSITLWAGPCLWGMSPSRPPFRMLSLVQVIIMIYIIINVILINFDQPSVDHAAFHIPNHCCLGLLLSLPFLCPFLEVYVDVAAQIIFHDKGRSYGFPVKDINTGNATGFTFMQVVRMILMMQERLFKFL